MPESSVVPPQPLSATQRGEGEPLVVLVHGWSCRRTDWNETLKTLDGRWHCLAVDLPGHGDSPAPEQGMTVEGLADQLVAELQRYTGGPIILVGHSMGGCVSLEAARRWSGELVGVVLVDTFGLPYGDMDEETISAIETPFREDFVAAMEGLVDNTTVQALDQDTRDWIKRRMAAGDPEQLLPLWHDLLRWSPDEAFAHLQGPIVAINGEHIPEPAQKRCAPFVAARVLPGTHHFPQFERPDAFHQALLTTLAAFSGAH